MTATEIAHTAIACLTTGIAIGRATRHDWRTAITLTTALLGT